MSGTRTPWMVDSWGQTMPNITASDSHERFKELSKAYWLDPSLIRKYENKHKLKEWTILCIAIAETSGGKKWAGEKNIGNVGNNDRGDRVEFSWLEKSLDMIGRTLNNRWLGKKQTIACLNKSWNCVEQGDNGMIYASSNAEGYWEKNMVRCLSSIYGDWAVDSQFRFRI